MTCQNRPLVRMSAVLREKAIRLDRTPADLPTHSSTPCTYGLLVRTPWQDVRISHQLASLDIDKDETRIWLFGV
jgi:hypothetical protein